jgi:hypothetical protein
LSGRLLKLQLLKLQLLKLQLYRMERQERETQLVFKIAIVSSFAVDAVPDQRVTEVLEVLPNLMVFAGLRPCLDEAISGGGVARVNGFGQFDASQGLISGASRLGRPALFSSQGLINDS